MLYAMLTGSYPFDSNLPDLERMTRMTRRPLSLPEKASGLSAECRELLEGMLHPNQHERMTVAQIKQHPWFLRCVEDTCTHGGVQLVHSDGITVQKDLEPPACCVCFNRPAIPSS
jgi:serine/threonine protein kinase